MTVSSKWPYYKIFVYNKRHSKNQSETLSIDEEQCKQNKTLDTYLKKAPIFDTLLRDYERLIETQSYGAEQFKIFYWFVRIWGYL